MVNVALSKKRLLAIAVAAAVCALIAAVPAYAFWYVHGNDYGASESENGVYEVLVTVDGSAQGEGVWAEQVFIPAGGTVSQALEQAVHADTESQNDVDAIHDYGYTSDGDFIAGSSYTIKVYNAESQNPGTQTTQDSEGTTVSDPDSTTLQRYDNVVVTLD